MKAADKPRPAPYPDDVRAKGWRFELDYERIRQSDTWALTPPAIRPWLLMIWMVAWEQAPCGSLPDSDALIAARIGMSQKLLSQHRAVLLRGWWVADDGRMYHPVITERVLAMVEAKRSERDRKARYRASLAADRPESGRSVPRDRRGTDAGLPRDSGGRDATGTGTGTSTGTERPGRADIARAPADEADSPNAGAAPATPEGAVCRAIKDAGIADATPSHPALRRLLAAGVPASEFVDVAQELATKRKGRFKLLLATVEGRRRDAMGSAEISAPASQDWRETKDGVIAKAREFGIPAWTEDGQVRGEVPDFLAYRRRVLRLAEGVADRTTA